MAPIPSQILYNSHAPLHLVPNSHKPVPPLNRFKSSFGRKSATRVGCLCHVRPLTSNAPRGLRALDLGISVRRHRTMGSDYLQIPAASAGGSDGDGGSGGSDGGSSDGRGDEEGGGDSTSFFSWYLTALEKHPVLTKALTSAVLTLIGDLICQLLIDRVRQLDLKRTFVFTFLGFALVGPTLHFWYLSLSKMVTFPGPAGAFLRLLLDQFLFSPTFIGVFLCSLVTLEGRPAEVVPKLRQEWFSSVVANWQLWIPFQFLNFQFVPQQFQVLAANVIALVWNVILSFKAHKAIVPK
ncbi:hypothetical protein H6P81_007879 [Aristolochia fimbriata]|uniref:MPV17 n=1 Tax=Aristolochia fimbriata TaxID=158543 RepID=A0AAV7F3S6_ARIFI|nr:hypothetical protein H6P81_007879 [Aristolochia fimbriata]